MSLNKYDFWLANESKEFGVIKGRILDIANEDAPICLQRGDKFFGEEHIKTRHAGWVSKTNLSVPELVWKKCRQTGTIYSTEETSKGKIMLPMPPSSLLVLRYIPKNNFWTVVTLYEHEGAIDGINLGRYIGTKETMAEINYSLSGAELKKNTENVKKQRL